MHEVRLDGQTLTAAVVTEVAQGGVSVALGDVAATRMSENASWYAEHGRSDVLRSKWAWLVGGTPPTTEDDAVRSFIEGHCAGVGAPLLRHEVRALMLVRANALAAGWSGVRPPVVERLLAFLARDWCPVVPRQGSVGAAGSVALAHVARVVLGLGGEAQTAQGLRAAEDLVEELPPLHVNEKEALSLINGSSLATALAALAVTQARHLLRTAEAACALSMEAIRADLGALHLGAARAHRHPGFATATQRLADLVRGSQLVTDKRRPDSFSVRCAPSVLGAARDALDHVIQVVERELNAASDNPTVLAHEGGVVEGGYFHGAPVGLAMDHLRVALVQLAGISERRTFRLTYGELSGLPSFLVPGSGVNSGLMLAQYTAASLVSEAKTLCMPGSVDVVPTVQHQEDHMPMAPSAARATLDVADRVADVLAIELLCGAQALDFRIAGEADDGHGVIVAVEPLHPGAGSLAVHQAVRARVSRMRDDRVLHPDLAALGQAVRDGVFSRDAW